MRQPRNNRWFGLACIQAVAITCCCIVIFTTPALAKTPFEKAQGFIESGYPTEARRALQAELRIRPDNLEARYDLAILLEDINHHDEAQKLYEKNISMGRHLPSYINLAAALNRQGDIDLAVQILRKATKQFRSEAVPWYLLAGYAEERGDKTEALKLFRKAIKADALNGFAYLYFASFQSRHKMSDSGLKYAAKASRLLPDCAPCWKKYGDILFRAGKAEQALTAYQRSLAIDPNPETRQQLVFTLRTLGQTERARHVQRGLDAERKHQAE